MTKVYCKDCKYLANTETYWYFAPVTQLCLANPYYKDTPLENVKYYKRCSDINTFNNCKQYKEKFWRKVWKSLASGTLN